MKYIVLLFLLLSFTNARSQSVPDKLFMVCGDSKVLLVNYTTSKDSIPNVVWSWDSKTDPSLPVKFRTLLKTVDDCKVYGDKILVSSSAGGVAIIDRKLNKAIFYAEVAMAHSVAMLPGNMLAAAASTQVKGNKVMLFDISKGNTPIYTDTLYSGHGVVWDKDKQSLFALGYSVLREYKLSNNTLTLKNEWKIPGRGGHDLQLTPDNKRLFLTTETSSAEFNLSTSTFDKIRDFGNIANVKSVGQDASAQFIYTIPEESWWTYHVKFNNPSRVFAFPGMHVYKARWFN